MFSQIDRLEWQDEMISLINVGPVVRPFLLEDGDEHQIELVEQCLVVSQGLFAVGALDDELHNEVADAW